MDLDARLDALCRPLRADVTSGASALAAAAADVFRHGALELPAGSPGELARALGALAVRILDAQPSMAPLLALASAVLRAVERTTEPAAAESTPALRAAAAEAATAFRDGLAARTEAVAERAAALLAAGGRTHATTSPARGPTLATTSASGTVRRALLRIAETGRAPHVLCFESRPGSEGRALARALAAAGVEVTFAVDAAADALVRGAGGPAHPERAGSRAPTVLLGADSIGDLGVVNKVGSAALARAARAAGAPVYVLADETKILPRGVPQRVDDDRPAAEVWPDAPRGIAVWNRYFEVVPLELVTAVVTESAVLEPDALERFRAALDLPAALRAWTPGRAHPPSRA